MLSKRRNIQVDESEESFTSSPLKELQPSNNLSVEDVKSGLQNPNPEVC